MSSGNHDRSSRSSIPRQNASGQATSSTPANDLTTHMAINHGNVQVALHHPQPIAGQSQGTAGCENRTHSLSSANTHGVSPVSVTPTPFPELGTSCEAQHDIRNNTHREYRHIPTIQITPASTPSTEPPSSPASVPHNPPPQAAPQRQTTDLSKLSSVQKINDNGSFTTLYYCRHPRQCMPAEFFETHFCTSVHEAYLASLRE